LRFSSARFATLERESAETARAHERAARRRRRSESRFGASHRVGAQTSDKGSV